MARWQLYTRLRMSELLRLTVRDVLEPARRVASDNSSHQPIDVIRKGRKNGYVIASATLLEETAGYLSQYREVWLRRAPAVAALFGNRRGWR